MARTKGRASKSDAGGNHQRASAGSGNQCKLFGIAQEWDALVEVRDRIREGGPVLHPNTVNQRIDIATCVLNHELLAPVCSRMCLAERKLPTVDDLRDEIVTVLTLGKRQGEDLVVMVEDTAKHIKSLCGLVKLKARRKEVSVATWT